MKKIKTSGAVLLTALVIFISSCGGDKKSEEPAPAPAADATASAPEPVNTIVTTPQSMVTIRHRVSDFAKWLPVFEAHDSARLASGLHKYVIGRSLEDSNMVLVALKADDVEKAKAFAKNPGLKDIMKKAGVTGTPEINFTNIVWQDTVNVGNIPRVLTTYSVKDWDTWKKAFEDGKQERLDNGVKDRQYGHDADDNHKISLVTAITDTAKARSYWTSDALKKRREAAGLTSEPKRFIFSIAKRY